MTAAQFETMQHSPKREGSGGAIAEGKLQEVLSDYRPPEIPVWICYLDRRFVSPRIQAFVEFLVSQITLLKAWCEVEKH